MHEVLIRFLIGSRAILGYHSLDGRDYRGTRRSCVAEFAPAQCIGKAFGSFQKKRRRGGKRICPRGTEYP